MHANVPVSVPSCTLRVASLIIHFLPWRSQTAAAVLLWPGKFFNLYTICRAHNVATLFTTPWTGWCTCVERKLRVQLFVLFEQVPYTVTTTTKNNNNKTENKESVVCIQWLFLLLSQLSPVEHSSKIVKCLVCAGHNLVACHVQTLIHLTRTTKATDYCEYDGQKMGISTSICASQGEAAGTWCKYA